MTSEHVDRRRGMALPEPSSRIPAAQQVLEQRPVVTFLGALAGIGILGVLDWATGAEIAFSVFYLVPVAVAAWSLTFRATAAISGAAAGTWLLADLTAGRDYSHALIPVWNTSTRFAVFMIVAGLIAQLQRSTRYEQVLARTDPLTGVSNSRWFYEQAAARLQSGVTLAYLDLDDFKAINDTYGHSGGDRALAAVGEALGAALRSDDVIGRLGGDEFAVLVATPEGGSAEHHLEAILTRVSQQLARSDPPVSFSAGAVSFAQPPSSVDAAVEAADEVMYDVKAAGKGAVRHRFWTGVDALP